MRQIVFKLSRFWIGMIGEVSFYAGYVAWLLEIISEMNRRIDPTNPLVIAGRAEA